MDAWKRRTRQWLYALLLTPLLSHDASAIWPFVPKRFKANALISAGSLGLETLDGRVAAFGDFNGDQFLDMLVLSENQMTMTIYYWNHESFMFKQGESFPTSSKVYNVVPGDYTHDGKLDFLVMSQLQINRGGWFETSADQLDMAVYVASQRGSGFEPEPLHVPSSSLQQPTPIDINGNMKIDLLGLAPTSGRPSLKLWQNVWDNSNASSILFEQKDSTLNAQVCEIADPHSNAVIDFDGDCLADLFLVCKSANSDLKTYQIWLNDKTAGFKLWKEGSLPSGIGAISFADMDRDGTIDIVFPTCKSISKLGVGTDCAINIAYNKQKPLCAKSTGSLSKAKDCREPDNLCTSDRDFKFNFDETADNNAFSRIPLESLFSTGPTALLMVDTTFTPPIPLPLRIGDTNLDGFPDLLPIMASNPRGSQLAISGDADTTPVLLESIKCTKNAPGCSNGAGDAGRRTFKVVRKDAADLSGIKDARGVAFLDMDEDGTLDIMVQRTGHQTGTKVTFFQNNFFHDAFFLKAIVLNGACNGWCTPVNSSGERYHPFGVSYSGASYKYTVLDTAGGRSAAQVGQLPQTSYQALQTPYTFFGLGRTNNYIENLFVGSTKHGSEHFINIEGVIPNSKVVIMPPEADDKPWKRELYLRPGEWIPWVTLTVIITTTLLAIVVFVLHLNEKREDELERRRALHHINFDAL